MSGVCVPIPVNPGDSCRAALKLENTRGGVGSAIPDPGDSRRAALKLTEVDDETPDQIRSRRIAAGSVAGNPDPGVRAGPH